MPDRPLIRLGHSPDPDDAFMFWALAAGAIDTRGFRFEQVLQDIQTLNEWALDGRLEVTAISLHAYPFVQDRYASYDTGFGRDIETGRANFRSLEKLVLTKLGEPTPRSGKQEYLENLLNTYLHG